VHNCDELEDISDLKIFLNASAGHSKRCGRPHVARGTLFAHPSPRLSSEDICNEYAAQTILCLSHAFPTEKIQKNPDFVSLFLIFKKARISKSAFKKAELATLYCGPSPVQLLNSHRFKTMTFLTIYHTGDNIGQKELTIFAVDRSLQKAKSHFIETKIYKNIRISDTAPNYISTSTWLRVISNMKSSSHKM